MEGEFVAFLYDEAAKNEVGKEDFVDLENGKNEQIRGEKKTEKSPKK